MKQSDYSSTISYSSLPNDVALKIASSLEVPDLCSLGSCSRFWRGLCGSDCIWEPLVKERWNALYALIKKDSVQVNWKDFYIKSHEEKRIQAESVIKFVERSSLSGSLEVTDYLRAIHSMDSNQFRFKDVQLFMFKPKLNVFLNLVGVHYCLSILELPASRVIEALQSIKISDRQVCVKWWQLGRWFYGFRMRDEIHSRCVSLEDLVTAKDDEVLGVLNRGAIHEILRIQISFAHSTSNPQSSQSSQ